MKIPPFKLSAAKISTFLLVLMLHVHADEPPPWLKPGLLNSTRIELKFGSYGVEVLAQDPIAKTRTSRLYSEHEGEKITRTMAYTQYEANMDERLKGAHQEILGGGSIGSTLKKHGFEVKKELLFKGHLQQAPEFARVVYKLSAKEENDYYPYCVITEVYSPEFLTLIEVDQIWNNFGQQ